MAEREASWSLLIYLWFLLAGFVLFSHPSLQASVERLRRFSLALALISLGSYLALTFELGWPAFGTPRYILVFALLGLGSWCFILAILGFSQRYLNISTPFLAYANEAVLPFYILHQPVLLSVGYFVVQWPVPALVKWAIILTVSFAIIMAFYEFLVQRFNVTRVLFGMKPQVERPAAHPGEVLLAE